MAALRAAGINDRLMSAANLVCFLPYLQPLSTLSGPHHVNMQQTMMSFFTDPQATGCAHQ